MCGPKLAASEKGVIEFTQSFVFRVYWPLRLAKSLAIPLSTTQRLLGTARALRFIPSCEWNVIVDSGFPWRFQVSPEISNTEHMIPDTRVGPAVDLRLPSLLLPEPRQLECLGKRHEIMPCKRIIAVGVSVYWQTTYGEQHFAALWHPAGMTSVAATMSASS